MAAEGHGLRIRDTLSGIFGSICLTYAGLPFDVVKLRLQTTTSVYTGAFDCMRKIAAVEGILRLWRGFGPALASSSIENAVLFTTNGFFKRLVSDHDEASLTFSEHALIGGLSGVFSATAICPAEVVKVRMQALAAGTSIQILYSTGYQCFRHLLRTEGVRGLFAGLTPLLIRDIPFNTIFFGTYKGYTHLARVATGTPSDKPLPGLVAFVAGGAAGSSAWAVVFPVDVLKSRMQVAVADAAGNKPGIISVGRTILKEGGVRLFYRGVSAAVMRAFPANAALFFGVETADSMLKKAGFD